MAYLWPRFELQREHFTWTEAVGMTEDAMACEEAMAMRCREIYWDTQNRTGKHGRFV